MQRWLAIALGAVGCGGSYCDRVQKAAEDCRETFTDEDQAECEERIAPCDDIDLGLLEDSVICLEKLGVCEDDGSMAFVSTSTGSTEADFAAILECNAPLTGLTAECAEAQFRSFE